MSAFDIESLPWSPPEIVNTRFGRRQVRTWIIPQGHAFWDAWHNQDLRSLGYTVKKFNGHWQATQWREVGGETTETQRRTEAAERAMDRVERSMSDAEPELPPFLSANYERIEPKLLEFQRSSVKRLAVAIAANGAALDASDTGTGKTFVSLGVAATLGLRPFIICPKPVVPAWNRAAAMMGVPLEGIINYEMLRTGNSDWGYWDEEKRKVFHFTDELDPESVLMVFDECHRMKDYKTKNCAMGMAALDHGFKTIGLSATAADNPMHMKFTGLATGLFQHPAHFFGWMTSNGVERGRFGYEFVGGRDVLRRIHRQIFPARGSRIRIAELGDRFPQTLIEVEAVELVHLDKELATAVGVKTLDPTRAIESIYAEMQREIAKLEATSAKDKGANILTEILRARQRVELLKVPTFVQMAQDGLAEGLSVIVSLNFDASIRAVAKRLRTVNTITGQDKLANRQSLVDAFNDDRQTLIVMNIRAGGLGISLHGHTNGRTRLQLISPTYSGIDTKQLLGRPHRAGGAYSIQRILFASGTIEERACEKMRAKITRIDTINDGDLDFTSPLVAASAHDVPRHRAGIADAMRILRDE